MPANDEWRSDGDGLLAPGPFDPIPCISRQADPSYLRQFLRVTDGITTALQQEMDRPFDIQDRSFLFATEIIDLCKPVMPPGGVTRELGRQLLRSGTSIGANLEEADAGQSKRDFIAKVAVSRKEARETRYWLRLLLHADARLEKNAAPLIDEARQLINILTTIKLNAEANLQRDENT